MAAAFDVFSLMLRFKLLLSCRELHQFYSFSISLLLRGQTWFISDTVSRQDLGKHESPQLYFTICKLLKDNALVSRFPLYGFKVIGCFFFVSLTRCHQSSSIYLTSYSMSEKRRGGFMPSPNCIYVKVNARKLSLNHWVHCWWW